MHGPSPARELDAPRLAPLPEATRPLRIPFAVPPTVSTVSTDVELNDPALFFNRELSWLDFNWRVLHQAMDERVPALERVRFLAITQNNLDEFFRTRVGGLKRLVEAGVTQLSPDGRTPVEQLRLIRDGAGTAYPDPLHNGLH